MDHPGTYIGWVRSELSGPPGHHSIGWRAPGVARRVRSATGREGSQVRAELGAGAAPSRSDVIGVAPHCMRENCSS